MGKFSKTTWIFFIIFLVSFVGNFILWFTGWDFLLIILQIIASLSGIGCLYFAVRDKKKIKFSYVTHVFWILFLLSIGTLGFSFLSYFSWVFPYYWFYWGSSFWYYVIEEIIIYSGISTAAFGLVLTILWILDRKKAIKTGELNDERFRKYSQGTKVFFWLFIASVLVILVGFFLELIFWSGFLLTIFGFYGAGISGLILLILWLRDRSKPKMRGPVYPSPPILPISIDDLKKMIGISSKILIQDLANALQTSRAQLLKFIADHRGELPVMQIDGEYLMIHLEKSEWVCQVCGFTNYGPQISCSECKSPYSK